MHKNTKLLPYQRREIYRRWQNGAKVAQLAREYMVTRKTLYRVFTKARLGVFVNYSSANRRYKSAYYGLRRLSKAEKTLVKKRLKRERRQNRYEKTYPGEMVHFDTKKLPNLSHEWKSECREWLYVAIDDYSRWLVADIFPDKKSYSAAIHLEEVKRFAPYKIRGVYSDNGSEYRGKPDHAFVQGCRRDDIKQGFTKPRNPQTNGKAERVIKTLMAEWNYGRHFTSRDQRRQFLYSYVNWYNHARPHQSLNNEPPIKRLERYLHRVKKEKSGYNA